MLQDRINALTLEVTAGPFKEAYGWLFFYNSDIKLNRDLSQLVLTLLKSSNVQNIMFGKFIFSLNPPCDAEKIKSTHIAMKFYFCNWWHPKLYRL